jgi:hypothetical protein
MSEDKTQRRFSIKTISISRNSYQKDSEFTAKMSVENMYGDEIKIKLPDDRIEALIESISDLVIDALQEQFTNMREDFQATIEAKAAKLLESQTIDAEATSG